MTKVVREGITPAAGAKMIYSANNPVCIYAAGFFLSANLCSNVAIFLPCKGVIS